MNVEQRISVVDALRPPDGWRVSFAVGTTYSLDFEALTAALLALSGAAEERETETTEDIAARLDALMEVGKNTCLFANRGSIRLPRKKSRLFGLYDKVVAEVMFKDGSFHPKVWVLELKPVATRSKQDRRYRVLCASRNLSSTNTWELAAYLEGTDRGQKGDRIALGASKLLAKLGEEKKTPSWVGEMARRVALASFGSLPHSQKEQSLLFQWPGKGGLGEARFGIPCAGRRVLVVSPFLDARFLKQIRGFREIILVSTRHALDEVARVIPKGAKQYAVNGSDEVDDMPGLDLHAKLIAWEVGRSRVTLVGSANATAPGFGLRDSEASRRRNAEAMVRLRPGLPIRSFLNEIVRKPWVKPYEAVETEPSEAEKKEKKLDVLARQLARALHLTGYHRENRLVIRATGRVTKAAEDLARIGPFHLPDDQDVPLSRARTTEGAAFEVPLADASGLVRIRLNDEAGNEKQYILTAELKVKGDRDVEARKVLLEACDVNSLLQAALRYERSPGAPRKPRNKPDGGGAGSGGNSGQGKDEDLGQVRPTLEHVLRTCLEAPHRIEKLAQILKAKPQAKALLPYFDDLEAAAIECGLLPPPNSPKRRRARS
jgi:hypothetical protein